MVFATKKILGRLHSKASLPKCASSFLSWKFSLHPEIHTTNDETKILPINTHFGRLFA